ncbi:NAD-dependent epimerase/dehydratase family protein [Microbacterium sp. C23T]
MTSPTAADWVIGRGLLGNAVARALPRAPLRRSVSWGDDAAAIEDLAEGLRALYATPSDQYRVFWCAGSGVTSSSADSLSREEAVFSAFVGMFAELPEDLRRRTVVFLASSVGGAYAGNPSPPFSERSLATPASAYGQTKLAMEEALGAAVAASGLRGFVGRITNLYGPGQKLGKRQGLISVVCETYLTRQAATIYVSLDTLRDYIFEDDAAAVIVAGAARAGSLARGSTALKIIGAGRAVSIGELVATIERVRGRRALVAYGPGNASGQALDLRVQSEQWTDLQSLVTTSLPVGIDAVFQAMLQTVARGPWAADAP